MCTNSRRYKNKINVIGSLSECILDCTCAGDIKLIGLCLERGTDPLPGFRPTTLPTDTPSGANTSWAIVSTSFVATTQSSGPVEGPSEAGAQAMTHTPANVAAHPYMNVIN